ncbi:MAG: hypothetical protein J0L72_07405 [Armatimonadetes bacterium]|nr:hypothetical protein [Armatimonadota bacterium]
MKHIAFGVLLLSASVGAAPLPSTGDWATPITVQEPYLPLAQFIANTKLPVKIDRSLSKRKLMIRVDARPANEVLTRIAEALDSDWLLKDGTYTLTPDPDLALKESEFLKETLTSNWDEIKKSLENIEKLRRLTPAELESRYRQITKNRETILKERGENWTERLEALDTEIGGGLQFLADRPDLHSALRSSRFLSLADWNDLRASRPVSLGACELYVDTVNSRFAFWNSGNLSVFELGESFAQDEPVDSRWLPLEENSKKFEKIPYAICLPPLTGKLGDAEWLFRSTEKSAMPIVMEALRDTRWNSSIKNSISNRIPLAGLKLSGYIRTSGDWIVLRPEGAVLSREDEPDESALAPIEAADSLELDDLARIASTLESGQWLAAAQGEIPSALDFRVIFELRSPLSHWRTLNKQNKDSLKSQRPVPLREFSTPAQNNFLEVIRAAQSGGRFRGTFANGQQSKANRDDLFYYAERQIKPCTLIDDGVVRVVGDINSVPDSSILDPSRVLIKTQVYEYVWNFYYGLSPVDCTFYSASTYWKGLPKNWGKIDENSPPPKDDGSHGPGT